MSKPTPRIANQPVTTPKDVLTEALRTGTPGMRTATPEPAGAAYLSRPQL